MTKIFLLPLTEDLLEGSSFHKLCAQYIKSEEAKGNKVYWLWEDLSLINYWDFNFLSRTFSVMRECDRVAVCWSGTTTTSIFNLGIWFAMWKLLRKPIEIINPEQLRRTEGQLENWLLKIHEKNLLQEARKCRALASCERASVGAVLVDRYGRIISRGANHCAAMETLEGCRRRDLPSGVQQELCGTIHDAVDALLNVRPNRDPADFAKCFNPTKPTAKLIRELFTSKERKTLCGARLIFSGHTAPCAVCWRWLRLLGIKEVKRDELFTSSISL